MEIYAFAGSSLSGNQHIDDLEALASNLRVEEQHPELTEWIQRCADVGSAHQDIDQVIEYLEALSELAGPNPDQELPDDLLGTVAGSLMVAAIVFYARATDTSPVKGERRKWFGDGKRSSEMRKTHHEVLNSRNKQIAHSGRVIAHGGGGKGCGRCGYLIHPADAVSSALWSE